MAKYIYFESTNEIYNQFDNYEIWPCILINQTDFVNNYEVCNSDDPDIAIWCVNGHFQTGGIECISDSDTYDEAKEFIEILPIMPLAPLTPFYVGFPIRLSFNALEFGQSYERPFLAKLWGYQSFHAISKGGVTPVDTKCIILFVTKDKQQALPQYNDYIDGNMLFWEGEEKHSSDKRVVEANKNQDEIHLFYRDTDHSPFVYFGRISLTDFQLRENTPSEFVFRMKMLSSEIDTFKEVREHAGEYKALDKTEQEQIVVSRLGQDNFRRNVIRLWGSCSVTGLQNVSWLRASHIKPWKDSNNQERLSPFNGLLLILGYDFLFDKGYITFKNNGKGIISQRLSTFARKVFDVSDDLQLRNVFPENKEYLDFHRSEVFE